MDHHQKAQQRVRFDLRDQQEYERRPCQDVRAEGQNLPVLQVAEAQKFYKLLTKAHKFLNKHSLGWVGAVNETTRLGIHPRLSLSKGRSKFLRDERA